MRHFSDDVLRIELTLKSNELRESENGLYLLANWENVDLETIFDDYYSRLTMNDQIELKLLDLDGLPSGVRATYQLWFDGHDVRSMVSRPTFYRHRNQLLEHGIDISMASNKVQPDRSNVVPLSTSYLPVPSWEVLTFEPLRI